MRYIYINTMLYVFNREYKFSYLKNRINVSVKKGDSIVTNFHSRLHEPEESLFLLRYLRPADTFIDIGANVGHFTLLAGVITQSNVIAIEPIPETFSRLQKNIALNNCQSKVQVYNIGVSDKDGFLNFSTTSYTTNKVIPENSIANKASKIPVKRIDSIDQTTTASVMKIDVEGFEYNVLLGATQLLENAKLNVIIIELNGSSESYGIPEESIIALLISQNFYPYRFDLSTNKLLKLESKNTLGFNTLFIRDIKFAQERVDKGLDVL